MIPSRADAWQLLTEWTTGESLRKHALAVEAAVRGYARMAGADEEEWGLVALLHDFDYERYPTAADHPFRGCEELQRRGYPHWVMKAILSHANYSGVPRETPLEHTLFACDEMAGFVTAAALVRPSKSVLDLEPASVIKRMKDKAFARGVSRDDLRLGAEELNLTLDTHVANVIGSRPDGWWRDRAGATRRLVAALEAFAERSGDEVTVVLDAGEPPSAERVEVLVARRRGRDAADDAIVEWLEAHGGPGVRVVTSDAELGRRARALGAEVEGAGGFRKRLD